MRCSATVTETSNIMRRETDEDEGGFGQIYDWYRGVRFWFSPYTTLYFFDRMKVWYGSGWCGNSMKWVKWIWWVELYTVQISYSHLSLDVCDVCEKWLNNQSLNRQCARSKMWKTAINQNDRSFGKLWLGYFLASNFST